jgi:hypothetical protein
VRLEQERESALGMTACGLGQVRERVQLVEYEVL